jgi:hypothetical protein
MRTIDRRSFVRGVLSRTAVAAAGLVGAETARAMPVDDRAPGALDDWIMKAQTVVVRPARVAALAAESDLAGRTVAAASAVGVGRSSTNTAILF